MLSIILPATNRLLPALVAAAFLALPACGFRGPLYLPGETPPGTETPAQAKEDEAATDETAPKQVDGQVDARVDTEGAAEEGDAEENDTDASSPAQP